MNAAHRVAVNTGFLYARMGITVFISLYTTRVILNALGADDFGIFNIVGGAIAMLTFLNTSMAAATQRFMSYAQGEGDAAKQKSIFNVSVILHAGIALVVLVILEGAGWVLFHGVFKIAPGRMHAAWMIYHFAAISTLFTIISVPYDAVINAHENMLLFAILGVVEAVLKLVIALFIIVHVAGDKLVFYGFWMAGIAIFLMLLRALYCHARYAECVIAPRSYFRKPLFREMTSFAGWSLLGSSSSLIANYGQGVVLNAFFGTVVNAAQGVANQVSGQLGAFAGMMLKALNPVIAKSEGEGDRQKMLRASMMGSKISFLLLVPMFVPVLVDMEFIFRVWLKSPPAYAILFCRLLLTRNLIDQLFVTLSASISAVGKIRNYQIISAFLNFLPLVAAFFLFQFGCSPEGIYYAYMGYSLIMAFVQMRVASDLCGLSTSSYMIDVVFRGGAVFAGALFVALVCRFMMPPGWLQLGSVCLSSTATYMGLIWIVGFSKSDRIQLLTQGKNLIKRIPLLSVFVERNAV